MPLRGLRQFAGIVAGAGCLLVATGTVAQEEVSFRVLGDVENTRQSKTVERPFFEETLPEMSNGRFDIQFRTMDEAGIKGFNALRLLERGTFDIMAMQLGYISGDEPFVLGLDLPGIAPTIETSKQVVDTYQPEIAELFAEEHNGKLLALWPFPGQAFFCSVPIESIEDIQGLKIRVYNANLANLIEELGGTAVSMSFPEVYQALQRGVVDCGITGTLPAYTANWYEVSTHVYTLYVGWAIQSHAANLDFWKGLSSEDQELLTRAFEKFEAENWEAADRFTQAGVNCLTGTGECDYGEPADMTLVEPSESDIAMFQKTAQEAVLPAWLEDCEASYSDCKKVWQETVGSVLQ